MHLLACAAAAARQGLEHVLELAQPAAAAASAEAGAQAVLLAGEHRAMCWVVAAAEASWGLTAAGTGGVGGDGFDAVWHLGTAEGHLAAAETAEEELSEQGSPLHQLWLPVLHQDRISLGLHFVGA